MSQHKKTIEKIRKLPLDKNIRFEDVEKLLIRLGFSVRQKGSHAVFYMEGLEHISIKKQNFIATYSIEDVKGILDLLGVEDDV